MITGRPLHNERGMALGIAILFLFVLSVLTALLHSTSLSEIGASSRYERSQQAFYAAEAGVRQALAWLAKQGIAPENNLAQMPAWFGDNLDDAAVTPEFSNFFKLGGAGKFYFRYRVEHVKDDYLPRTGEESAKIGPVVHYYRITAEGSDTDDATGGIRKTVQVVTTVRY